MITIKALDKSYNIEMLKILASSPMRTPAMKLQFDRSPDLFRINELWSDNYQYYGVFISNQLVGFGKHLEYQGYLNQKEENISYFGDFCIKPEFRRNGYFKALNEFMARKCIKKNSFGFTIILDGNKAANSYFRKEQYEYLTGYKILSPTVTKTILITGPKKVNTVLKIRKAVENDKKIIIEWIKNEKRDLSPVFSGKNFEKKINGNYGLSIEDYFLAYQDNKLIGICGKWDMKSLKRTRVLSYRKKIFWIYFAYSIFRKIFKNPPLPKSGQDFSEIYLTDVIIKENDPEIFSDLLSVIYNASREKGYHLIHYGSFRKDPLLKAFRQFFSVSLKSSIYITSLNPANLDLIATKPLISKPFFDITRI